MPNIFRTGRATNFKLGTQMEHEDSHQRQPPWHPKSKVKVARSRDAPDTCWPIRREQNVLVIQKLVERSCTPRAITRTSFKVKGQRSRSPGAHNVETGSASYLPNGKAYMNFKLGVQMENEDPYRRDGPSPAKRKLRS